MPFFTMSLKDARWGLPIKVFFSFAYVAFIVLLDLNLGGWWFTYCHFVLFSGLWIVGWADQMNPQAKWAAKLIGFLRYNKWVWTMTGLIGMLFLSPIFVRPLCGHFSATAKMICAALAFYSFMIGMMNEWHIEHQDTRKIMDEAGCLKEWDEAQAKR